METLDPSILGWGALGWGALTGPAGGGILTLGVPSLAGLTSLCGCLGVDGLTGLTPARAPLRAGTVPLPAGDLMALPAILTAGLGAALCEKVLLAADLTVCRSLSCSPCSQSGCRMLLSGSGLHTRQLQLPVEASLM